MRDMATALVPDEDSFQKPPGMKLRRSARDRITRPPALHITRPSASVIPTRKSPSSATESSCWVSSGMARRIGDSVQRSPASAASWPGAALQAVSTVTPQRIHEASTSGDTLGPAGSVSNRDRSRSNRLRRSTRSCCIRSPPGTSNLKPTTPGACWGRPPRRKDPRPLPRRFPTPAARGRQPAAARPRASCCQGSRRWCFSSAEKCSPALRGAHQRCASGVISSTSSSAADVSTRNVVPSRSSVVTVITTPSCAQRCR